MKAILLVLLLICAIEQMASSVVKRQLQDEEAPEEKDPEPTTPPEPTETEAPEEAPAETEDADESDKPKRVVRKPAAEETDDAAPEDDDEKKEEEEDEDSKEIRLKEELEKLNEETYKAFESNFDISEDFNFEDMD